MDGLMGLKGDRGFPGEIGEIGPIIKGEKGTYENELLNFRTYEEVVEVSTNRRPAVLIGFSLTALMRRRESAK